MNNFKMKLKSYDVIGNIAILKFPRGTKKEIKINLAKKLLKEKKSLSTIVEKVERVKGRLRTLRVRHLCGKKTLEALYIENNCRFKLNIESCYFSPRLSNERKEIAQQVKPNERILVMFSGVGPFAVVIAKSVKTSKVVAVELGKTCNKDAKENVKLNNLSNVKTIQGDVKKIIPKLKEKFDRIVMPRPNLKELFLREAFKVIKSKGIVNYYDFGKDKNEIIKKIKKESLKNKKKIKILRVKKAGETAPRNFRWRIDFKIL